jgi:hypothetical protein
MTAPRRRSGQPSNWTPGCSRLRSARSPCAWPPRARSPRRSGTYTEAVQWFAATGMPRQADPGRLGAGHQPRHPAVDGMAARPLQPRVRQQPVPGPAAVLQMAGRRGPAARSDGVAPVVKTGTYFRSVLRSTPRLCDISFSDLPACQCTSISATSITSNVLLAIGPPSQTGGKVAPSRWPGPPRHARRPHGELRDRGGELHDRQPLRAGELHDRRQVAAQV